MNLEIVQNFMEVDVSKTDAVTFEGKKLEFYNEECAVCYAYRTTHVGVYVYSRYTSVGGLLLSAGGTLGTWALGAVRQEGSRNRRVLRLLLKLS